MYSIEEKTKDDYNINDDGGCEGHRARDEREARSIKTIMGWGAFDILRVS